MVISVGNDHAGYGLKVKMISYLELLGHTIIDNRNNGVEDVVFSPKVARAVCRPALEGTAECGTMFCGTGVGASVACNKIPGIRASIVHDYQCAHQCVEHGHVNVMCIGEKVAGEWLAEDLPKAFLGAAGDTDERTAHTIQLLAQMDQRQQGEAMGKRYIFDADTYASPYSNFNKNINACQWEERMKRTGVAHAIVWLLLQGVVDVTESNRYIGREAQKNKRIASFGWANMREEAEKTREDARLCLEEYGYAGVKLNRAQNEYYIDCPEAMSVMEVVAACNDMIAFHIGADYPDFTDPIRAERAVRAFPDTKFLMMHMGEAGEPDVSQRVIEIAVRNPNMYPMGSAMPATKVKATINTLGPDRILFGSNMPFYDAADVIREHDRMLSGYDEEVRRKIMGENVRRLFGLPVQSV